MGAQEYFWLSRQRLEITVFRLYARAEQNGKEERKEGRTSSSIHFIYSFIKMSFNARNAKDYSNV